MAPIDYLKFALELAVLLIVLREIRALRRHESLLADHGTQLKSSRPLFTTLYSDADEIMEFAVRFTEEAKEIDGLGTITSLTATECRPGETESSDSFQARLANADPLALRYVAANRDFILSGKHLRRILDFRPATGSQEEVFELLANIKFFLRAHEFGAASPVNAELFHNPDVLRGSGDFHFRCSDRCVVLRVGGHGNPAANAAIAVSDTRVVEEFRSYFDALIDSPITRLITVRDLRAIQEALLDRQFSKIDDLLSVNSRAPHA